jgi:hypothetical protein
MDKKLITKYLTEAFLEEAATPGLDTAAKINKEDGKRRIKLVQSSLQTTKKFQRKKLKVKRRWHRTNSMQPTLKRFTMMIWKPSMA